MAIIEIEQIGVYNKNKTITEEPWFRLKGLKSVKISILLNKSTSKHLIPLSLLEIHEFFCFYET